MGLNPTYPNNQGIVQPGIQFQQQVPQQTYNPNNPFGSMVGKFCDADLKTSKDCYTL